MLYVVFGSMLACNLLYLVLGFVFAKAFARITLIPDAYLWPAVFILSVVGAYAPQQSIAVSGRRQRTSAARRPGSFATSPAMLSTWRPRRAPHP